MGYNVSYKNGANGISNFIKGRPSNLWDFVCDHPIISFLIADKVITGVVNIVNGKVNGREIDTDKLKEWMTGMTTTTSESIVCLQNQIDDLKKDQQLNEGRLEALEKADDRFEELLNKLIEVTNIDISDVGSGSDKIVVDEADTEVKD